MGLLKEKKQEVIGNFKVHDTDTGSAPVQIAIITERINGLSGHFKQHAKDHSSRRGLLALVGRRRKLLNYLKRADSRQYADVLKKLNLRK